eukprot:TRINITY_DN48578_c0_g1_i1.p1 TRINITY_DN48578_c0_g1~~TRINITY_DN48578_c0_g1_i1.p1  ORF type:complete len:393 (+),score=76.34 TRINITY_DN48578_c0_g1_i1:154-1332(+)
MPTKEEISLFATMDGGTGDVKQDAQMVKQLRKIVEVPNDQLLAFVRTRDRHSVGRLQQVLQDLPRPNTTGGGGHVLDKVERRPATVPAGATQALSRASTAPSGALFATAPAAVDPQQRLRDMCSMTSSYKSHFCGGGKPRPVHDSVYGSLKDEFRKSGGFEDWAKSAPDEQVRALADTCRTVRFFGKKGGHATTYSTHFVEFDDTSAARCKLLGRDMTESKVPIGSLGRTSKAEETAFQARQSFQDTCVEEARRRERDIFTGTSLRPEKRMHMTGSFSHLIEVPEAQKIGAEQGAPAPSRDWKALARASWVPDVHSKVQVARHAHNRIKQGEKMNKELSNSKLFSKMCAERTEQYGHIKSAHEPVFDVRNPKDSTGQKYSRFTYAKHSHFVP